MIWRIFFFAVTVVGGQVDYEMGINQDRVFASEAQCEEWLADDTNYDAELNAVSAVRPAEIVFGCASDDELPNYLLPGTGT